MDVKELERLLMRDFSVGTEAFRDELLSRCLEVLGSESAELDDLALDQLAAAGDARTLVQGADVEDAWPL